jgi:hypothetical protein
MWPVNQAKFWPKNPVMNVRGRNTVAMIASCFITPLRRFDTVDVYTSIALDNRSRQLSIRSLIRIRWS